MLTSSQNGGEQMREMFDPEKVAEFEHAVWSRCAKGYMQGFGALVNEAITPLLDAAQVIFPAAGVLRR